MRNLFLILILAGAAHLGWQHYAGIDAATATAMAGTSPSLDQLQALARGVGPGEVVMYTTSECPYSAQARSWLSQYGFTYTDCNMSLDRRCEQEMQSHGGNGVPYLIVRGHHMKDGFDSDEFIAALKR